MTGRRPFDPLLGLMFRPLLGAALLSLVINLLQLAPSIFMLQVFDRVLVSRSTDTLLILLLGVGLAMSLNLALDYLRSRLQGVIGSLVGDALSPAVARRMIAAAARRTDGIPQAGTLRDVNAVRQAFSAQPLVAVLDAPWLIVYLGAIALASPWLGALALACAIVMLGLALLNDRMTRSGIESVQQEASRTQRWLDHALGNAEVAHTLGMADALLARWQVMNAATVDIQLATARRSVAIHAITRTFRIAMQSLALALGAYLVITQQASPGVMIATTVLLGRALAPVEQVVGAWRVLAEGRAAWGRLRTLFTREDEESGRMALPPPAGQLAAQGLTLRSTSGAERLLLAGVSFSLEPGESLAIVGPSGAGKSTLLRLLAGMWRPNAGSVRLDRVDLAQWPRAQLGPHIGYVPQDVELFAGTVAENIARMGEVDSARVVRAAKRARAHDLVLGLPNGYDTVIDPQGPMVSPGQRQRIALARALYGDPKLLLLDEPNANLDGAGELALGEVLRSLHGEVTVIVVTHRTGLVQHVDKMLVLEGGRVQQFGPTAEVRARMQRPSPETAQSPAAPVRPRDPAPSGAPATSSTKADATEAAVASVASASATARSRSPGSEVEAAARGVPYPSGMASAAPGNPQRSADSSREAPSAIPHSDALPSVGGVA